MMTENSNIPSIRFAGFTDPWEQRKVEEVVSEVSRPVVLDDDKLYQLVTVRRRNEGVASRGYLKGKDILVKSYFEIHAGDYLISKRQIVHGANGYVPESLDNAVVSNEYLVIVGNENISTAYWSLISQRREMYRMFMLSSYGVDIEKLVFNVDDWKKRILRIPAVKEQQQLIGFFSRLDDLITLHQRKHDKLVVFKKAMLEQMFPQEGETVPKIRFAGFTDPWEQRKLGEIAASFDYGLNAAATTFDGENGYLRITDIDDSTRQFSKSDLTSPDADLAQCQDSLLHEGDIVFARTGASVGKTYIYRECDGATYFAGFLIRMKIKSGIVPQFVFQTTLSETYKRYVDITSQRSGQPGVNAEEYADCPISVPSFTEQQAIGRFFSRLDDLITLHQRKLELLRNIKKSLLDKMFV